MASDKNLCLTKLSSIHPYPAMIADELVLRLAQKHGRRGGRFLDPFCGTARTVMASAALGMESVGLDINPLAILIAQAKAAAATPQELTSLLNKSALDRIREPPEYALEPNRKVSWLPQRASLELRQILFWLNSSSASREARIVLSALLSATTREVSYCRKAQWKLHRMAASERQKHNPSAWNVFTRRLKKTISDLEGQAASRASAPTHFLCGDCTRLTQIPALSQNDPFDLVITSPPYGDSRTTVSYGDVSSLCLGVLQHVANVGLQYIPSRVIDNSCLGGDGAKRAESGFNLRDYWAGGKNNEARSRSQDFLLDIQTCCHELNSLLAQRSTVVFVVARRSAGGRRLYLDEFLSDQFYDFGFKLKSSETRNIVGKLTPSVVNSRGASAESVRVNTMRQEIILCFTRGQRR